MDMRDLKGLVQLSLRATLGNFLFGFKQATCGKTEEVPRSLRRMVPLN